MEVTEYSQVCTWSYETNNKTSTVTSSGVKTEQQVMVLQDLAFCDYSIRFSNSAQETTVKRTVDIPKFKDSGTKLKVNCQVGRTALSKVVYACEREFDPEANKAPFWTAEEPDPEEPEEPEVPVKPVVPSAPKEPALDRVLNTVVELVYMAFLYSTVANWAIQGSCPCATSLLDLVDITSYLSSSGVNVMQMDLATQTMLALNLYLYFPDFYFCSENYEENLYWKTEKNFWYMLYYEQYTLNSKEAVVYMANSAVQGGVSGYKIVQDPTYAKQEVPKIITTIQKNSYYALTDTDLTVQFEEWMVVIEEYVGTV